MPNLTRKPGRGSSITRLSPAMIALIAVLIALVTVFTLVVRVPTLAGGYGNLSGVAITFASLAFGPWVGLVAGGIGTFLADLIGFPPFAPISLVAHGLEGLLIGLIGWGRRSIRWMIVAWLAGSVAMVTTYLLGETFILYAGNWAPALSELPTNIVQAAIGGALGIPLYLLVRAAYPPIERLGRRQTWTEE